MSLEDRAIIRLGRGSPWLGLSGSQWLMNRVSLRKVRLYAGAWAREVIQHLDPYCNTFLDVLEAIADSGVSNDELDTATKKITTLRKENPPALVCEYPNINVGYIYRMLKDSLSNDPKKVFRSIRRNFFRAQVDDFSVQDNIEDILSDLFWPLVQEYEFSESWLTKPVVSIAQKIYEDKLFDEIPILADALEEAGCAEPALLVHCRQPAIHVRGCWVLDRILGLVLNQAKMFGLFA